MKRSPHWCLVVLLLLVATFHQSPLAASTPEPQVLTLALVGAKIYRSPDAKPVPDGVVVVRGDRIVEVGTHGKVKVPAEATVVDCRGTVLLAGFWNSHVHLTEPKWADAASADAATLSKQFEEMFTRYGFTTVFDTGSDFRNTGVLRRRIDEDEVRGPKLLTTGGPIVPKDGTPIYVRPAKLPEADTPERGRALAAETLGWGVDGIKLFSGSWLGGDDVAVMPVPIVAAIAAEAHRAGKPVLAHPQSMAGIQAAIDGGVDVLVHTAPVVGAWDKKLVERMKRAKIALVPTLTLWRVEMEREKVPAEPARRFETAGIDQLRAFASAGGHVLFGTDVGYIPVYDPTEEYTRMAQAGMDFRAILASLTTAPAERFRATHATGRVDPGAGADLVVIAGDPEADVTALANVVFVIRQGRLVLARAPGAPSR